MTPQKYIGRWFDPKGKTSIQTTTTTTYSIHYHEVHFYQPFPVLSHFRTRSPLLGAASLTVYMNQLLGFMQGEKGTLVCKLNQLLYGLAPAARIWYNMLNSYLIHIGF